MVVPGLPDHGSVWRARSQLCPLCQAAALPALPGHGTRRVLFAAGWGKLWFWEAQSHPDCAVAWPVAAGLVLVAWFHVLTEPLWFTKGPVYMYSF